MTSNKEFISQTQETPAKKSAAKAPPQFNPHNGSLRKLLGTKEDETVLLSIHKKASFSLMQKLNSNTEVSK
jgi:hypothetical protein